MTRPPLLLINGYAATTADWDPTFLAALGESMELLHAENRGVGENPLREQGEALSAETMAAEAEALLDRTFARAGREVPLRVLIDWRSGAPLLVAASGASDRREALVSFWPSAGLARLALSRRRSALCPSGDSATASLRSASSKSQKGRGKVLL